MKECIYCINKSVLKTDEGEEYTAYGIEARTIKHGKYIIEQCIPNLFFEYERAKELVDLCNSLEISLVHLMDVIEDELS